MARLILTLMDNVLSNHLVSTGNEVTIGRHTDNQIVIDNSAVSSRHAKIEQTSAGLKLMDMDSTNGTYVNNKRVTQCQLFHQDWVTIGKHVIIIDLYETLGLEETVQMLMGDSPGTSEADQTVMFDLSTDSSKQVTYDRLISLSGEKWNYTLFKNVVTIGKSKNADIVISGFWSFLAGQPAASITRRGLEYFLGFEGGMLKPKVNDLAVRSNVKLHHQDIIKLGSLKMQVELSQPTRR